MLAEAGAELERVFLLEAITDSYWTRDFGPWWTGDGVVGAQRAATGIGDFVYDRPRPNDNEISAQLAQDFDVLYESSDLLLSGGNMMVDSLGYAAATDLIYEINGPDYTREEVDQEFERAWGVQMRAYPDPTGTCPTCFTQFSSRPDGSVLSRRQWSWNNSLLVPPRED